MQKFVKLYKGFIYVLPAVLFFSYYPVISLGSNESMNLELSLPLIWLALFDILSIILLILVIKPKRDYFGISDRHFFFLSLFPFYCTVSIFWSPNTTRAVLTAGIVWALFFAIFSIVFLAKHILKQDIETKEQRFKTNILKSFIYSSVIISIWCWLQSILDLAGVDRGATLMCEGCTTNVLGFPHSNGFAIEPQFMGNLLLAPALYEAYVFIKKPNKKDGILSGFFFATLFLTLSRGAIFAAAIGVVVLIITKIYQAKNARPLVIIPIIIAALVFTLNTQGIFAATSKTNETYLSGIAKSLNQLSLGIIKLPFKPEPIKQQVAQETIIEDSNDVMNGGSGIEDNLDEINEALFSGYITESTEERLKMNEHAFNVWKKDIKTITTGVGLGGAGMAMQKEGEIPNSNEIVQNEYISLLLEVGFLGISCAVIGIIMILAFVSKHKNRHLIYALIISYGITLLFFSGLPNALHIYLLPALLIYIL